MWNCTHFRHLTDEQLQLRDFEQHQLDNDEDLEVAHPQSAFSCTIPGKNSNLEKLVLRRGENWSTQRKTSQSKGENQFLVFT